MGRVKPEKGIHRHLQRVPGGTTPAQQALATEMLPETAVSQADIAGDQERARRFAYAPGVTISKKPHLDEQLKSAHVTCYLVLKFLEGQASVKRGQLNDEELRAFVRVAGEVLPKIIREERELQKAERLDDMDEAQLLALNEEARKVLSAGQEEPE